MHVLFVSWAVGLEKVLLVNCKKQKHGIAMVCSDIFHGNTNGAIQSAQMLQYSNKTCSIFPIPS